MTDDVLFQDKDVCILNPNSKKGVLVYNISGSKNICVEGLLSYNELKKRHPELKLIDRHHIDPNHDNLIFFRAPYNSDISSFESSYDNKPPKEMLIKRKQEVISIIRIDPEKTFVYSSEIRAEGNYKDLQSSRISMRDYLSRIHENSSVNALYPNKPCSNLITYRKRSVPSTQTCLYPEIEYLPIERMAEIVVNIPNIPPDWFVSCEHNNIGGSKRRRNRKIKNTKKRLIIKSRQTLRNDYRN